MLPITGLVLLSLPQLTVDDTHVDRFSVTTPSLTRLRMPGGASYRLLLELSSLALTNPL